MILLQCPNCLRIKDWYRETEPKPGYCPKCHSRRPWNVVTKRPEVGPGFVKVMSSQGYQYLEGPHFQENPKGWIKE